MESPKESNKQWEARIICGFDCLSRPTEDRFWAKIVKGNTPDDCWEWAGSTSWSGYGMLGRSREPGQIIASRFSYELHKGPIPTRMNVLHTCDNPPCCNPNHLVLGTQQSNIDDCIRKGRFKFLQPRLGPRKMSPTQLAVLNEKVKAIPPRFQGRKRFLSALAIEFGVSINTLYSMLRHLEIPL